MNKKSAVYLLTNRANGALYTGVTREKQIKAGSRKAKVKLINSKNPGWRDLYPDILS